MLFKRKFEISNFFHNQNIIVNETMHQPNSWRTLYCIALIFIHVDFFFNSIDNITNSTSTLISEVV